MNSTRHNDFDRFKMTTMKHFALILLAALTWSVNAQITYPYNPDGNEDQFISIADLQDLLVHYGQEFEPGELLVDSIPLSAYLEAMEALILANAMPEGTNPGQFLRWNGDAWELVMPKVGCTLTEACNYDETAHVLLESMCVLPDACGVCGGPGAVYDCGCADIPEGECDCDGNVVDALGVCGGTCEADEDGDGICDDGDSCVGQADECGVCNGPGAIYDCGCTEPVEGTCDCDGNVEDVLGVCGGSCTADEDFDGICDDVDDCVGAYDGCGVCNGPGPVLACGCNDIPEGFCDCNGNVLDAVGTCGGACQNDLNGDGICDDGSIPGCIYSQACNYDPSASIYDGSCDFTSCYGCTDPTACNFSPSYTVENGSCSYPGCTDEAACNFDGAAGCDDDTCTYPGCTDSAACNFDVASGCDDGSCVYPGCTDPSACNWDEMAVCDDGSCTYPGCTTEGFCNYDATAGCDDGSCENESCFGCMDTMACNFSEYATTDDGSCDFTSCYGCIDAAACNYDETLTLDDGSCVYPGCSDAEATNFDESAGCDDGSCVYSGCTVDLACNYNPLATIEDGSCEFGNCPGCNDPNSINYNPTSTNSDDCFVCGDSYLYQGYTYSTEEVAGQCWMVENLRYLPFVTPDNHGSCYGEFISVGGYQGTDVQEALSMLSGTDGALYSGPAAYNLELCPNGFHVPDNSEWDSFLTAGGTVMIQDNFVVCGEGVGYFGSGQGYYWSSSSEGWLWYFIDGQYADWNGCCYQEYQMLIKCVSD